MPEHRDHNQADRHADARQRRREVVDVLTEALWTLLCRGDDSREAREQGREHASENISGPRNGSNASH